uniref:L,D-transpeptidase family protein n=1 Tax=uncultured Sphingomonas sp. TaxID=158754 RepID=UPI0026005636|nr:L,D-transpeptidase family protein [uncultured Sphingomonas sp.]
MTRLALLAGLALLSGACRDYTDMPLTEEMFGSDEIVQAEGLHDPAFATDGPRVRFQPAQLPVISLAPGQERAIGSVLNVPEAMRYGEHVWNDEGVPPGKPWILVDLKAQTLSVFRGRDEIGTAVTLYGVDEKPTPTGRFTVLAKMKDHRSSLYDAPMPYTLRLTGDGIAIHGSDVRDGAGTHGCLGIPLEFASLLFQQVPVGSEVVILRDASASMKSRVRAAPGALS